MLIISPDQITSTTHNFTCNCWEHSEIVLFSTDVSQRLTGLDILMMEEAGRIPLKLLINVGTADLVLGHDDNGSLSANRMKNVVGGVDITLVPGAKLWAFADVAAGFWRI